MSRNSLLSRRCCLLVLLLSGGLSGCGESAEVIEQRERADFDKYIDASHKKKEWAWVEGVQYLEKGGLYFDTGEAGEPTYDKSHVLPLLKRISARHGLKWQAIVDKKDRSFALAFVAQYPDIDGARKAVMDTLNEEQKSFPIDILVTEGNRWLSIDFMSREDSTFLEEGSVTKRDNRK